MIDRKRGSHPINGLSIRTDHDHVTMTQHRHLSKGRIARRGSGLSRRPAAMPRAKDKIDMKTYTIDPNAVADAIVQRLLEGRTIRA